MTSTNDVITRWRATRGGRLYEVCAWLLCCLLSPREEHEQVPLYFSVKKCYAIISAEAPTDSSYTVKL